RFERLMQWSVLLGLGLIFTAQYFSNLPYSIYSHSNFWTDSPTLILIRLGITLLLMAGAYLWTEYCVGPGWSGIQCLGKNSLMVCGVHGLSVYGTIVKRLKPGLDLPQVVRATLVVTGLMVALSAYWLRWKSGRAAPRRAAESAAVEQLQPVE